MAKRQSQLAQIQQTFTTKTQALRQRGKRTYSRITAFIAKYPIWSFFITLGLLLAILIFGRLLQKPPQTITTEPQTKEIRVFSIGKTPKATFQAKVEKSGVVSILAQSPGIISAVHVKPGDRIGAGQTLVSLASNYQGGNAQSVQRQIAQTQYQNTLDSFGLQIGLIDKQRSVATASAENAQQVRDITQKTVDDTSNQINNLQSQLDQLNQTITQLTTQLQTTPSDTTLQSQLTQSKQAATQIESTLAQLRSAQRSAQYQASNTNPPAQLAGFQKDLTLNQLDVQQKSLEMGKEISRLQSVLASIAESTMYPASPFTGIVERVNVHEGQVVNPGSILATVTSDSVSTQAVLLVPQGVAQQIITGEPSTIQVNGTSYPLTPKHVATQATDGQLYAVTFAIPDEAQKFMSDGDYIDIEIPFGEVKPTSQDPLIPVDAIYVSQDKAQLLVVNKDKAEVRTITLGKVYGNFVEVFTGVTPNDSVILDRNVIAGDRVAIQK